MKIPIQLKLKKRVHQDIAYSQDIIMDEVYNFFPKAVLHGGNAIWRCYQGNRFSEDIDVYLSEKEPLNNLFKSFEKKGFRIIKKRVKEDSLYSEMEFMRVNIRLEATFRKIKESIIKEYETSDGNLINVYTLDPLELVREKISACIKRRKVRDLYDIFFLLRYIEKRKDLGLERLRDIKIEDEENLKALIISGPIPTVKEMRRYIEEWAK